MAQDTSCLYSAVRNVSGGRKHFSFLPPHGRTLDDDEEFLVFGHIQEAIVRGDRVTSMQQLRGFESAVQRGDMIVVHTPNPILLDVDDGTTIQMLVADNDALALADPCWETTSTDDLDPV